MSKRKVHYREPWSFVDLKYDGMYEKERLKGNLKKIYQKQTRNRLKRETEKLIKEEIL